MDSGLVEVEVEEDHPVGQISMANKNVHDIKYLGGICTRHQRFPSAWKPSSSKWRAREGKKPEALRRNIFPLFLAVTGTRGASLNVRPPGLPSSYWLHRWNAIERKGEFSSRIHPLDIHSLQPPLQLKALHNNLWWWWCWCCEGEVRRGRPINLAYFSTTSWDAVQVAVFLSIEVLLLLPSPTTAHTPVPLILGACGNRFFCYK